MSHISHYSLEASYFCFVLRDGPRVASQKAHRQKRQHAASRREKAAHSVLHRSSSHNPHGQIFSFPPGRQPVQRISPRLTTLHCPDERTYTAMNTVTSSPNETNTYTPLPNVFCYIFLESNARHQQGFTFPDFPNVGIDNLTKHASTVQPAVSFIC